MKNEIALFPKDLWSLICSPHLIQSFTLFDDSGKRRNFCRIYDEKFHREYDIIAAKKYHYPTYARPVASTRNFQASLLYRKNPYTNESEFVVIEGKKIIQLRTKYAEVISIMRGEKQTNFLPLNKQKHVFSVAEYMYRHAGEYGQNPEDMYLLGLLHDIGYLRGSYGHGENGGEICRRNMYRYAEEIKYHGKHQDEYSSPALDLLNEADLMIDSQGNEVGFKQRLNDIKKRYGKDSNNYIFSKKLVERIQSNNLK